MPSASLSGKREKVSDEELRALGERSGEVKEHFEVHLLTSNWAMY